MFIFALLSNVTNYGLYQHAADNRFGKTLANREVYHDFIDLIFNYYVRATLKPLYFTLYIVEGLSFRSTPRDIVV